MTVLLLHTDEQTLGVEPTGELVAQRGVVLLHTRRANGTAQPAGVALREPHDALPRLVSRHHLDLDGEVLRERTAERVSDLAPPLGQRPPLVVPGEAELARLEGLDRGGPHVRRVTDDDDVERRHVSDVRVVARAAPAAGTNW
jgi:hypothetical protein